ncbi:FtsW/RodA/SpoVE family cell cycle protein [Ruminococcus sp. 5_1_39BFAA]|uniref:FtsW/RodA/SpoVE family cell cycle protein n=1 Tax=Ruminococcus sp. 5_1_39BFAA TaxID=457412 RepID=UPI00356521BB
MARKKEKQTYRADMTLLALVLLLVVFGLVMLFSTSEYNGRVRFHDSAYYFKKQLFATALGLLAMYVVSRMDYRFFARLAPAAYLLSMGLSTAVLLFGQEINGSKRWLNLGPLSFQPSEFAKVAVILFLAWQIDRTERNTAGFWFMCRTMLTLLPIVGLVGSNNLSTAIIILGIGVILIFVSNPKYAQFIGLGAAGVGFVAVFLAAESYRLERLAIWRNPEKYEKGFQTIQGLYAIGSGGLFGRGLGSSLQKLGFVPEAQNDMIFSIICEELGLVGASALIVIFGLLLWRLCVISLHSRDLLGSLICAGIMGHMAIQVILNIAVVTNTIPNTGITLPFISYGGTSVVFLLGEMGLALSVSSHNQPPPAYDRR